MFAQQCRARIGLRQCGAGVRTLALAAGLLLAAIMVESSGPVASGSTAYAKATGHWALVGSMSTPRVHHTATLLEDGRVLVAGGGDGQSVLSSAELYDPSTGQWSPTGSMATGRAFHSATRLADGRVLVVGGADDLRTFRSAELYDPLSGTWSTASSPNTTLAEQQAVLLPNGMVLVVGGTSDRRIGNQVDSTYVYNPDTEQWYDGTHLTTPRRSLALSMLTDGRVLASGGFGQGDVLASADLLDPSTGELATATIPESTADGVPVTVKQTWFTPQWAAVGGMTTPREEHTSTLLADGTVLIAGGVKRDQPADLHAAALNTAEVFDPLEQRWTPAGMLTMDRVLHTATLTPTGQVLVAGGLSTQCSTGVPSCVKKTAEVYDPLKQSWTGIDDMSNFRSEHTATLLQDGTVLLVGGRGAKTVGVSVEPLATAEVYQP